MRCGWTLPRYVGNAVVRNRLRRWSRVYFRTLLAKMEPGAKTLPIDVNLVFRKPEIKGVDSEDFYKKLKYDSFADVLDRAWKQVERRYEILVAASDRSVQGGGSRPSGRRMPV